VAHIISESVSHFLQCEATACRNADIYHALVVQIQGRNKKNAHYQAQLAFWAIEIIFKVFAS